jgi:hypothetical protein
LSASSASGLARGRHGRIAELDTLNTGLDAWTQQINEDQRHVDWRFTTKDARIKLRHLYPVL